MAVMVSAVLAGCMSMPQGGGGGEGAAGTSRQPSMVGAAAAVAVVVAAQTYRDRIQSELTQARDPNKIAEKQALITSLDTIKMRMVNFNSAMTLGEKLQIASSVSDIVKAKFPNRADMVSSADMLVQVVMTAMNAANQAAAAEAAAAKR
jgi:hypothetical protein